MDFRDLRAKYSDREAAYPSHLDSPNKEDLDYIMNRYECKYPQSFIDFQLKEYSRTPMGYFAFDGFGWANRTLMPYMNLEEIVKDYRELGYPNYLTPFRSENGDFCCFDIRKTNVSGEYPVVIGDHNSNNIENDPEFKWKDFFDWLDRTMVENEE